MSNGARLVSARLPMTKMPNATAARTTYQRCWLSCARTMLTMLSEPAIRITLTRISVTATS
jgi:hypothetical protein